MNEKVDIYIGSYSDWRGIRLAELRNLINSTAPELNEDYKWSVPVWTGNKMVLAISAFKDHVKINFFHGSALSDNLGLFNSGLDSKDHRSVNISETDKLDEVGLKKLIMEAYEKDLNV